ncbi:MAG: YjbH domain-containing protein [Rhodocyclaceae bacterium]
MHPATRPPCPQKRLVQLLASAAGTLFFAGYCNVAAAQNTDATAVIPGERLSAWLMRQPQYAAGHAYLPGVLWQVPEEVSRQTIIKARLLDTLKADPTHAALAKWLEARPVTGRSTVAIGEPRWLEGIPAQDPVLRSGQQVRLPVRPTTVTVVLDSGDACQVPHVPGESAGEYLRACMTPEDAARRSVVWIAQPDGRQQRFGIGNWNAESQTPPAPGAWIWAPRADSGLDEAFSADMVRFLGTQGAADDGAGFQVPNPLVITQRAPQVLRALPITSNDWGEIGLLQTPTARMAPAGDIRVHISKVSPYTRVSVVLQPLDWLSGAFRYTDVKDVPYDPTFTISDQSYKDKSIDVRARIWKESERLPEIVVGIRDLGGTGLFSGEYVVASKRFGNFDWSLGLGWGYVGARQNLPNPLSFISNRFDTRTRSTTTGETNTSNYFRGRTSLFGGVQWHTPIDPLVLKLEYDGNDYQSEPFGAQRQRIPFNFGATYQLSNAVNLTAGFERGTTAMLGITLHTDLSRSISPKVFDPPYPAMPAQPRQTMPDWRTAADEISRQTGWYVEGIDIQGDTLHLKVDDANSAYRQERIDRAVAALNLYAPAGVGTFSVDFVRHGMALDSQIVNRADWVARKTTAEAPAIRGNRGLAYGTAVDRLRSDDTVPSSVAPTADAAPRVQAPATAPSPAPADAPIIAPSSLDTSWKSERDRLRGGLQPSFYQSFGGPDAFMLYQIGVRGWAEYRITPQTLLGGEANLRILDNYDKFKFQGYSELPRVRTHVREYVTSSRLTLTNLQLTHVEQPTRNNFVSVYGGLLESMFAGVGAEWLYRPVASNWAVGVDVNRVRQRDYDQGFGLLDYTVNTGHVTLYWNTGWNGIFARVAAGQYLAGDRGVTVNISRRFDNGVVMGVWATKTNVSAEQFGEGSFDKGIYLTIPFDAMLPRSSTVSGTFVWQPLLRDGGAMLGRSQRLYSITNTRDRDAFRFAPPEDKRDKSPDTGEDIFAPTQP